MATVIPINIFQRIESKIETNMYVALNSCIIGDLLKIAEPTGSRYQRPDIRNFPENSTRVTATWCAGLPRQRHKSIRRLLTIKYPLRSKRARSRDF